MPGLAYLRERVLARLEREASAELAQAVQVTNPARRLSGVNAEKQEETMAGPEGQPVSPVPLTMLTRDGRLEGSNGRYEKFLVDLEGLYRDEDAFREARSGDDGSPVYWVESSQTEDGPGGLITGISVLEPGRIGQEYAMTYRVEPNPDHRGYRPTGRA